MTNIRLSEANLDWLKRSMFKLETGAFRGSMVDIIAVELLQTNRFGLYDDAAFVLGYHGDNDYYVSYADRGGPCLIEPIMGHFNKQGIGEALMALITELLGRQPAVRPMIFGI